MRNTFRRCEARIVLMIPFAAILYSPTETLAVPFWVRHRTSPSWGRRWRRRLHRRRPPGHSRAWDHSAAWRGHAWPNLLRVAIAKAGRREVAVTGGVGFGAAWVNLASLHSNCHRNGSTPSPCPCERRGRRYPPPSGPRHPLVILSFPWSEFVLHPPPQASCTSGARGPISLTGSTPATTAAP